LRSGISNDIKLCRNEIVAAYDENGQYQGIKIGTEEDQTLEAAPSLLGKEFNKLLEQYFNSDIIIDGNK
jgi:hypothetical protein